MRTSIALLIGGGMLSAALPLAAQQAASGSLDDVLGTTAAEQPAPAAAPASSAPAAPPPAAAGAAPANVPANSETAAAAANPAPADASASTADAADSVPVTSTPGLQKAGRSRVVEEIIVTAQKREEDERNVPISISAFSGDALEARGVDDSSALPMVTPGLTYNNLVGYSLIYIRGVGSDAFEPTADASVATYIDGVYLPFAHGLAQNFVKLERVEVLKGPQYHYQETERFVRGGFRRRLRQLQGTRSQGFYHRTHPARADRQRLAALHPGRFLLQIAAFFSAAESRHQY
jgi:iron complex outermembrane receptor protein